MLINSDCDCNTDNNVSTYCDSNSNSETNDSVDAGIDESGYLL